MPIPVIVDSLEDVPEPIREEYVERDGRYELQLDGAVSVADRDRLQRALAKEREDHKASKKRLQSYGELTPEKIEELTSERDELKLQLEAAGSQDDEERTKKIEELAEKRAALRVRPFERKVKEFQAELENISGERDRLLQEKRTNTVLSAVTDASLLKEAGVVPDAVEDVKLWALHNFEIDEATGKVVSKETLGTPGLAPKEVFADMKSQGTRRHWFGATSGAGATGGKASESFGENPFAQDKFSLTKIGAIVRQDPEKARRMAAAASTKDWDAKRFLPKELRG